MHAEVQCCAYYLAVSQYFCRLQKINPELNELVQLIHIIQFKFCIYHHIIGGLIKKNTEYTRSGHL